MKDFEHFPMTKKAGRPAEVRYNHNHDPVTGRFVSAASVSKRYSNGGAKPIDKSEKSGIIKSQEKKSDSINGSGHIKDNIEIGRSVGASGKNYPVKLPDGNHSKFAEGTEIVDIKTFAGKGTNIPIREAIFLENDYGIKAEKWEKVRGTGYVLDKNTPRKAEVHWYEAEDLKVKMKVKRWYDES